MKKAVPAREVSGFRLRLRTLFPFCWRDLGVCIVILVLATLLCHFLRLFDKSDVFVALIFELARWSLLAQYLVHFLVTGAVYLPFLLLTNLPLQGWSILLIPGNVLLTYGITWSIQHNINKMQIRAINAALEGRRHGGN